MHDGCDDDLDFSLFWALRYDVRICFHFRRRQSACERGHTRGGGDPVWLPPEPFLPGSQKNRRTSPQDALTTPSILCQQGDSISACGTSHPSLRL